MTSEVLILNKHAVVLGADSAVTTTPARDGEHPRYSKTANKLFELSDKGNVAVMIYGGAQIDAVPWEVAIKLFRSNLGTTEFPSVDLYLKELLSFLQDNAQLFGGDVLKHLTDARFEFAIKEVLKRASRIDQKIFDVSVELDARKASWQTASSTINQALDAKGVQTPLSNAALDRELSAATLRVPGVATQLGREPELAAVDASDLTNLALKALYAIGNEFLSSTGLVVAGYGERDIFPGYRKVEVYGHIGSELLFCKEDKFHVTHSESSMIKGWAQTSMIDVFTDGFGYPLWKIISERSRDGLLNFAGELQAAGVTIPQTVLDEAANTVHNNFMKAWTAENYEENWQPLRAVLSSLGVQEMAHLAETLLTLQAVKERVTSSSESVGGPIDVAAITKAEGLIWLKRKHFFESDLNLRYVSRLQNRLEQ